VEKLLYFEMFCDWVRYRSFNFEWNLWLFFLSYWHFMYKNETRWRVQCTCNL